MHIIDFQDKRTNVHTIHNDVVLIHNDMVLIHNDMLLKNVTPTYFGGQATIIRGVS
jgi:hypothetical protein